MRSLADDDNLTLPCQNMSMMRLIYSKRANFDLIILETSGIGQSDTEILDHSKVSLYVMTPEYGAATQLEKIDMLDFADMIALNKFDKKGSLGCDPGRQRNNFKEINSCGILTSMIYPFTEPLPLSLTTPAQMLCTRGSLIELNKKIIRRHSSHTLELVSQTTRIKSLSFHQKGSGILSEITESNKRYDQWAASTSLANCSTAIWHLSDDLSFMRRPGKLTPMPFRT